MSSLWGTLAPVYDAMMIPARHLRRKVVELAGVASGAHVLDVATGTGAQAFAFAEAGATVIGLDLSDSMLRVARRKARKRGLDVTFVAGDARALPFEDARFDVVTVSLGLHEMPVSVRREALAEMARVTKPDGRVVIVDYALPDGVVLNRLVFDVVKLYERDSYAEFVRSDLSAMLRDAGLAITAEKRVIGGVLSIWIAKRTNDGSGSRA